MQKLSKGLFYLFLIVSVVFPVSNFAQGNTNLPKINYQEYKLKNGLTVVLHQDKATPIVAVNLFTTSARKTKPRAERDSPTFSNI